MNEQYVAGVLARRVPVMFQYAVRDALHLARDLRLGVVAVRWWQHVQASTPGARRIDADTRGWIIRSVTDEINLVIDAMEGCDLQVKRTALHELRHLWQDQNGRYQDDEAAELDCNSYVWQKLDAPAGVYVQIADYGYTVMP